MTTTEEILSLVELMKQANKSTRLMSFEHCAPNSIIRSGQEFSCRYGIENGKIYTATCFFDFQTAKMDFLVTDNKIQPVWQVGEDCFTKVCFGIKNLWHMRGSDCKVEFGLMTGFSDSGARLNMCYFHKVRKLGMEYEVYWQSLYNEAISDALNYFR